MSRLTARKPWCVVVCRVTYVSTNCTEVMVYCSVQSHMSRLTARKPWCIVLTVNLIKTLLSFSFIWEHRKINVIKLIPSFLLVWFKLSPIKQFPKKILNASIVPFQKHILLIVTSYFLTSVITLGFVYKSRSFCFFNTTIIYTFIIYHVLFSYRFFFSTPNIFSSYNRNNYSFRKGMCVRSSK